MTIDMQYREPDWRIGLTVTPKMKDHPLHGQSGRCAEVHEDGYGGLRDPDGILAIVLYSDGRLVLAGASEWMTA